MTFTIKSKYRKFLLLDWQICRYFQKAIIFASFLSFFSFYKKAFRAYVHIKFCIIFALRIHCLFTCELDLWYYSTFKYFVIYKTKDECKIFIAVPYFLKRNRCGTGLWLEHHLGETQTCCPRLSETYEQLCSISSCSDSFAFCTYIALISHKLSVSVVKIFFPNEIR